MGGCVIHPYGAVGDGTGEEDLCGLFERRKNVGEDDDGIIVDG